MLSILKNTLGSNESKIKLLEVYIKLFNNSESNIISIIRNYNKLLERETIEAISNLIEYNINNGLIYDEKLFEFKFKKILDGNYETLENVN